MSEILFYGGGIAAGVTLFLALITLIIFIFRWMRLCTQLDSEYGKKR